MLGAIVIAGSECTKSNSDYGVGSFSTPVDLGLFSEGIASIPVLGCSTIGRMAESIRRAGIDDVSVFGERKHGIRRATELNTPGLDLAEEWRSAARQFGIYRERGFEAVLIARTGAYIECEFAALFERHREHGESVTRVFDHEGPLDVWIVDPSRVDESNGLLTELQNAESADCALGGYVNRLESVRDLRRFAIDILTLRCRTRPAGVEVRPSLWLADGAQVARSARLVAPAYIGRGVKITDDCLITRCSNVEANSYVDFGTAVEDSSILPETYVGIGLDLSHSLVYGSEIFNLHHDVRLRISDPVVLRKHTARAHGGRSTFETNEVAFSTTGRQ